MTMTFTAGGVRAGFLRMLPVSLGVAAFGMVIGMLAGQKGLSAVEIGLMSTLVFAGASQAVALDLWTHPVPVLTLALTAGLVNLRYLIMNMALKPWLGTVGPLRAYGSLFFSADESWAVALAEWRGGNRDAAVLLGAGLALWLPWVASTVAGRLFGALVADPRRYALDFVGTAVFLALLASFWTGRRDLLPWGVAGVAAVIAQALLPGSWFLVVGGLAGSLAGALRDAR